MIITLHKSGGFAGVPGLERRIAVDTQSIDPQVAARLIESIRRLDFFNLPSNPALPGGAADHFSYEVGVADGGNQHTVTFADPLSSALSELISELDRLAP